MQNKKLLIIAVFVCLGTAIFAEEPEEFKWEKVGGYKVAFICRVVITNDLDMDFYAIGFDAIGYKGSVPRYGYVYYEIPAKEVPIMSMSGKLGEFSQTIFNASDVRKRFYLQQFIVKLFDRDYLSMLQLPVGMDVSFPSEAHYVYFGTFVYTLEGYDLMPSAVKRLDEFDDAQKLLKKKLGADVQLYRAELIEHKEENKK